MALESGTYISDLNPSNPVGATDKVSTLDDHVRLIKATLQTTFPGIAGAVTATHTELSFLDGVTGTTGTGKLVLDDTPTIADLTVTDSITLPAASIADAALSDNVPLKNAPNTFTAPLTISTNTNWLYFLEADAGENEKLSRIQGASGSLLWTTRTDADSAGETWLSVQRNGVEVTEIELNADALDFNGALDLSGNLTLGGSAISSGAVAWTNTGTLVIGASDTTVRLQGGDDGGGGPGAGFQVTAGGAAAVIRAGGVGSGNTVATFAAATTTIANALTVTGAARAGTAATSTSSTLAAGQIHHRSANTTVPSMNAGQWVAVQNTSTSSITLSEGSGVTLELGGTTTTGNRTLLEKGFAFIYFRANGVGVVHGNGVV